MKYNIIGDIHGRDAWKRLVMEDAVNIFLGDYFDPYQYEGTRNADAVAENLKSILQYKEEHPETILLLGNHDLHYIWDEHYSRYNAKAAPKYRKIITDNWDKFALAYAIDDEALMTHAGVTREWLHLAGHPELNQPTEIANMLNDLKDDPKGFSLLKVELTFEPWDIYGESATASPIWVRPETLIEHNALEVGRQVVGHTQMPNPAEVENVCLVDSLGTTESSLLIEKKGTHYSYEVYTPSREN